LFENAGSTPRVGASPTGISEKDHAL